MDPPCMKSWTAYVAMHRVISLVGDSPWAGHFFHAVNAVFNVREIRKLESRPNNLPVKSGSDLRSSICLPVCPVSPSSHTSMPRAMRIIRNEDRRKCRYRSTHPRPTLAQQESSQPSLFRMPLNSFNLALFSHGQPLKDPRESIEHFIEHGKDFRL